MRVVMFRSLLAAAVAAATPFAAPAQNREEHFDLGEIVVIGAQPARKTGRSIARAWIRRSISRRASSARSIRTGAERAANLEVGWEARTRSGLRASAALFYSDVSDLIQTVVLPDATTQPQNVGDGEFNGVEGALEAEVSDRLTAGGNYTYTHREVRDALLPNLRPTGVPASKAFFYATLRPRSRFRITPSVERDNLELAVGGKNLTDENYEIVWGFPQPGRNYYAKIRMTF